MASRRKESIGEVGVDANSMLIEAGFLDGKIFFVERNGDLLPIDGVNVTHDGNTAVELPLDDVTPKKG